MTRTEHRSHRYRIGKNFRSKGEKLGLSITIWCLIPPPGETVPVELTKRCAITACKDEEWPLVEKYLRAFNVPIPTRYQARKLAARIRKRFPGASNFWMQPSYRMY